MNAPNYQDERAIIRAMSAELLARSVGQKRPTVIELTRVTSLPRWKLTHRHRDLNDEFQRLAEEKWGVSAPASRKLADDLLEFRAKHERALLRILELEQLVDTYAVVIEELRIQNDPTTMTSVLPFRPRL